MNHEAENIVPLVESVFQSLNESYIPYCHWKSNVDLDKTFCALGDLDLLIDREYYNEFTALILELGFKRGVSTWERQFPGMEDYIGWDKETDVLVHLHVHYQLVLGATYLKSIHLPIERLFLEKSRMSGIVKIPSPECECVVFILRHIMKVRSFDVIMKRQIKDSVIEELDYLYGQCDQQEIKNVIKMCNISISTFEFMILSIRERTPEKIIKAKRIIERELSVYQRVGLIERLMRPIAARIVFRIRKFSGKCQSGKMVASGGALISIVGCDGSGKSSVVEGLYNWLSSLYGVQTFHLGKPSQSVLSYFMLRISDRVIKYFNNRKKNSHNNGIVAIAKIMQQFFLARDRYLTLKKINRVVGCGMIAITDRYPLSELTTMESMAGIYNNKYSQSCIMCKVLTLIERYYSFFREPTLLIVLKTTLCDAIARRPEEDRTSIGCRIKEVDKISDKPFIKSIKTDKPITDVIKDVKHYVWDKL